MRILAIRGCNLASLAGEFEIDLAHGPLAEAGVFAIVGNTGAGKSTLLDALCAALFDRTPRLTNHSRVVVGRGDDDPAALGAHDVRTILRRGASAGWAEVDFESRDERRYRARWSVRRARGQTDGNLQDQQVTLTAIDGGDRPLERLGGTKTETLKAIHARLGLTFDQFRRSALLAQGEFAAFLRADGRDRSELLERMTGTEIYSKLSVAAHLRASLAEHALRDGKAAAFAIAVLDDGARAEAEVELGIARDAKVAARERLVAAEAAARWLAEARRRDATLATAERDRAEASRAVDAAAPIRGELELRRRADTLRALWNESERLDRRAQIAETELAAAATEIQRAELARADIAATTERLRALHEPVRAARLAAGLVERAAAASAAEARARAAAGDASWLVARAKLAPELANWAELDAKFTQHDSIVDAITAADRALRGYADQHAKLKRTRETTAADHQQAVAQLADAQHKAAAFQQRRGPTLDAARRLEDEARVRCSDVERLGAIALGARMATASRAEIDRQLAEQTDAVSNDARQRIAAEQARTTAVAVRDERVRHVNDLRTAAGYEHARAELVDGDPCPLCGAVEHPWRDRGAFDDIIRDAEMRLAQVSNTVDTTTAALASIKARETQRAAERTRLESARAIAEASAIAAGPIWREALSSLGELMLVDDPASPAAHTVADERLAQANAKLEEARTLRSLAEAATKAAADAQALVATFQSNIDIVDTKLRDLDRKLGDLDATMGRVRAEREVRVSQQRDLASELDVTFARWTHVIAPSTELQSATTERHLGMRRTAMSALVKAWHERASAVVEADGSIVAALAVVEQTAREVDRIAVEHAARRDEATRRRDELTSERASARERLESSRITTGFEIDELRRLLAGDTGGRADALAEQLAVLDRAVERTMAVVAERRRLVEDHRETRPESLASLVAAVRPSADGVLDSVSRESTSRESTTTGALTRASGSVADLPRRPMLRLVDRDFDPDDSSWIRDAAGAAVEEPERADGEATSAVDEAATIDIAIIDKAVAHFAALAAEAEGHAARLDATLAADADARVRRDVAFAELARIEAAGSIDRVLGDVIGSHDGKLFRSFAQSLTLDSLLAVANSHLEELSPRYQLERVPRHDLELQVVDRDLGDEVRSVQSLSGGESFLVSLALALGLSSMSAHDVRVRTLLIDEGFGTLDPSTLDTALAVLDALQATGRQVGVISHVPALVERVGAHVRVVQRGGGRSEVIVPSA